MAAKKIFIRDNDLDPGADITLEVVTDKYQPTFPHDPNVPTQKPRVEIYNINENQAPYFYNLVHLVGSYMGDTRSLNAVAMVDKAIHPIAIVSAYIGNYFMGTGEFGMFVGAEARMDSKKNSRVRPTTAAARSPAQLLVFINAQGNKLLSAFKARYKAVVKSHGTPRPDTTADWINTSL
ncbi:hypothetical protein ACOMHN_038942 [Nucella lapillus]